MLKTRLQRTDFFPSTLLARSAVVDHDVINGIATNELLSVTRDEE